MIDLDGEEYDTGQLLQFGLLQKIIMKLAKNTKELVEKLEDLQFQGSNKDKKLEELENKYNVTTANQDKRFRGIEITLSKLSSDNKKKGNNEELGKRSSINIPIVVDPSYELEKKKEEEDQRMKEVEREKEKERERKLDREHKYEREREMVKEKEKEIERLKSEFAKQTQPKDINFNERNNQETPEKQKESKEQHAIPSEPKHFSNISKEQTNTIHYITQARNATLIKDTFDFKLSDEDNQILETINTKPQSSEMLSILFKKVIKNERRVAELEKLNQVLSLHENKILTNEDGIGQSSNKITKIQGDIEGFQRKINEMEKSFEEIRVKVVDFSIYDLFKDNGDGTIDASKALITTLETKVFKKFSLFEERIKEVEENNFKIKNDMLAVSNLSDSTHRNILQIQENYAKFRESVQGKTEQLNHAIGNLDKNMNDYNSQLVNRLSEEIARLTALINEKEIQLTQNMKDMIDDNSIKGIQSGASVSEGDIKIIKDLSKKVNEFEKTIKLIMSNSNTEMLNQQIQNIQSELQNKITRVDLNELYDKSRNLANFEKEMKEKTNQLIDKEDQLSNEVNFLTKKMETLYGMCINIQNTSSDNQSSGLRQPVLDISKFIDQARFNENNKIIEKKIEHIKLEEEDLRRTVDDIIKKMKLMPNDEDFKAFEQSILATLDENKLHSVKRFADKIDTNKTYKYLETQIKQIIEMYTKKMENGDSWLLAKKPMNNYQCASCESNIRDLTQKYDYLPWNKYPMRDDKAYRMGHGFSRMLQMVNMDILKTAEMNRDHSSDDEKDQRPLSSNKDKSKLPKVHKGGVTKSVQEVTLSDDDIYSDGVHRPTDPKVVKIYKKIKHINLETEPR